MRLYVWLWLGALLSTGCQGSEEPKDSPSNAATDTDADTDECDGFVDLDGDGYGGAAATLEDCDESRVSNSLDCDDSDPAAGGGVEVPYNGRDEDCDPATPDDDLDGDGALVADDCNDQNPNSTTVATDADCDGVVTALDCDDTDPTSLVQALDADCDGAGTADDCDDEDPEMGSVAYDADCDGALVGVDCDDADAELGDPAFDADCDGTLTSDDCDDDDPALPSWEDRDCDRVHQDDDCNDFDPRYGDVALDGDCDRVLTADDCDDARGNHWLYDESGTACREVPQLASLDPRRTVSFTGGRPAHAGDLNGDGYDDVFLGPQLLLGGATARGSFAAGPATYEITGGICGQVPSGTRAAGDVDGDGLDDLMFDVDGCAPVIVASAELPPPIPGQTVDVDLSGLGISFQIERGAWAFEDLDGDGLTDVIVLGQELGVGGAGLVYGFWGTTLQGLTSVGVGDADFMIDDVTTSSMRAVSSIVDVDGDGVREVVVASSTSIFQTGVLPPENTIFVHHSSSLIPGVVLTSVDAQQVILDPLGKYDNFGGILVPGGDFDGDGVEDLIVSGGRGVETAFLQPAIHAISGAQLQLGGDIDVEVDAATVSERGSASGEVWWDDQYFGNSVAFLGDLDGDGAGDYVTTNFREWQKYSSQERNLTVFSGGQLGWGERATIWQADYYLPVTGVEYETIENLGDLDGDGHVELRVADTVVWGPLLP